MMKILLIRPVDIYKRNFHVTPDIGLGYLAAALRKNGYSPSILLCDKEKMSLKDFEKHVISEKPDIVCIKVFTYDILSVQKSIGIIKTVDKSINILLGGPHISALPGKLFEQFQGVDYGIVGEGERSLPELIDLLGKDKMDHELGNIPGLIWKNNGNVIVNSVHIVEDLDEFGLPAWDLMDPRGFPDAPFTGFGQNFPIAPLIVSRGCPYPCTFCGAHLIFGKKIRHRSVDLVLEEIRMLQKDYNVEEVQFLDDNFTADKAYVTRLSTAMLENGTKVKWSCPNGLRCDLIDDETVAIMKKSGFYACSIGIESANTHTLERMSKGITIEKVKKAIDILKSHDIKVTGFFILGFPGENGEDINRTIRLSRQLRLDKALFSNFMPLPGSAEYDKLLDEGKLNADKYGSHYWKASFPPEGVTSEEIKKYQWKAVLGFYLRPRILLGLRGEIVSFNQVKYLLKKLASLFLMK